MTRRRPGIRFEAGQTWRGKDGAERTILALIPPSPGQQAAVRISRPNGVGGQLETVITQLSLKVWVYTWRAKEIADAG